MGKKSDVERKWASDLCFPVCIACTIIFYVVFGLIVLNWKFHDKITTVGPLRSVCISACGAISLVFLFATQQAVREFLSKKISSMIVAKQDPGVIPPKADVDPDVERLDSGEVTAEEVGLFRTENGRISRVLTFLDEHGRGAERRERCKENPTRVLFSAYLWFQLLSDVPCLEAPSCEPLQHLWLLHEQVPS